MQEKYLCKMEMVFNLDGINNAAKEFLFKTGGSTVFAFQGSMGAGKTTFIHAICEAMNVTDIVSSPTFSIINQYQTKGGKTIYHIDLYRLNDEAEVVAAGVEECIYSGKTCFIEWPEKAPYILPTDTLFAYISLLNEKTRKIEWQ